MGKRPEWERNNGDMRETKTASERRDREHDMPRRGIGGRLRLRLSAHLPTQRIPFPQGCLAWIAPSPRPVPGALAHPPPWQAPRASREALFL